MSFQAMAWATEQRAGGSSAKIVLLMLANRINHDTGMCMPSIKRLADECEMSISSVKRALKSLAEAGLIEIIHRFHDGAQISSQYRLLIGGCGYPGKGGLGGFGDDKGGVPPGSGGGVTMTPGWGHHDPRVGSPRATNNQEVNQEVNQSYVDSKPSTPVCPHEKIIESYHELCPTLPKVKVWTDARKKFLASRWRESPKHQSLEFWERYFGYVATSQFLLGADGKWQADLEWLVRPSNFVKVIEGKYHREVAP